MCELTKNVVYVQKITILAYNGRELTDWLNTVHRTHIIRGLDIKYVYKSIDVCSIDCGFV